MLEARRFLEFFAAASDDPRITGTHISLYMELLRHWKDHQYKCPFHLFSHSIIGTARILSSTTYHRTIRDLNDFGYIKYEPSFKRTQGSKIYILKCDAVVKYKSIQSVNQVL
jgi:hypothetical protein